MLVSTRIVVLWVMVIVIARMLGSERGGFGGLVGAGCKCWVAFMNDCGEMMGILVNGVSWVFGH